MPSSPERCKGPDTKCPNRLYAIWAQRQYLPFWFVNLSLIIYLNFARNTQFRPQLEIPNFALKSLLSTIGSYSMLYDAGVDLILHASPRRRRPRTPCRTTPAPSSTPAAASYSMQYERPAAASYNMEHEAGAGVVLHAVRRRHRPCTVCKKLRHVAAHDAGCSDSSGSTHSRRGLDGGHGACPTEDI